MTAGASFRTLVNDVFFPLQPRATLLRYGFACVSVAVAFGCRVALIPLLFEHSPLLIFTVPVAATAITAGFGPAIVATLLGAAASTWFFPPLGVFGIWPEHVRIGLVEMTMFVVSGVLVAALGGALRRRRWAAELAAESLRRAVAERDAALDKIQVLSGLLPICAGCKRIRDEQGNWRQMEAYISAHSAARFSHGMCPKCERQWYGD